MMAERYNIGDLTVDARDGTVTRCGEALSLPPLSFRLLVALARRAPHVVRREELLETVWPKEFVNDDTLSQRVRLLRDSLGDFTENPRYIASLRGWGYRLIAPVERLEGPPETIHSLAVLPLANLMGDPQLEYFADGMTEALISALTKIRSLKVISRTSVIGYKRTDKQAPQIARELRVDALIEGTVLLTKERVRVSVQLVNAVNDEHLWAECYDRDFGDVLALHAELAMAIARKIRTVMTADEEEWFEKRHRVDPEVLEAYLKAQYFLAKITPEDADRAIGWFERAIAGDALFAEGHAGLARACIQRSLPIGADLSARTQRQILARGKTAAKQAVSLDEKLAQAHADIGMTLLCGDWDWRGAEREMEWALELEPNSPYSHLYMAFLASTRLDCARTLGELRSAISLDPVNLLCRAQAAEICYWIRDCSQAIAYASQTLELDPSFRRAHFILGRVYEAQERIEEAIAEYERAAALTSGGAAAARQALQQSQAAGYHRWTLEARFGGMGNRVVDGSSAQRSADDRLVYLARNYARLGEVDKAIKCLEQSYEERECLLILLKALEVWDPLRSDARFEDLVRRIGIP